MIEFLSRRRWRGLRERRLHVFAPSADGRHRAQQFAAGRLQQEVVGRLPCRNGSGRRVSRAGLDGAQPEQSCKNKYRGRASREPTTEGLPLSLSAPPERGELWRTPLIFPAKIA